MVFVIMLIAAFALGTGFYFLQKKGDPKRILPWVSWGINIVQTTITHWGFQRKYRNEAELVARLAALSAVVAAGETELRDTRKTVEGILDLAYATYSPEKKLKGTEKDFMMAAYIAAISHKELMETLASVSESPHNLDVAKATTLWIDILGETIELKDKLGQQYFQHLIYGLNKSLLVIRDKGTDPRALKEVSTTLFRVYKISKAYRMRRRLSGMKAGEVYDKIISLLEHVTYVIAVK